MGVAKFTDSLLIDLKAHAGWRGDLRARLFKSITISPRGCWEWRGTVSMLSSVDSDESVMRFHLRTWPR